MNITITCPSCRKLIKTSFASQEQLPEKIKCPGCSHVGPSPTYGVICNTSKDEKIEPVNAYAAHAKPIVSQPEQASQIKAPRQPNQLDIMFDIGHTRTKRYAQVLWVAAIVAAISLDCYLVMFSIARASIVGILGIVAVHAILMPMVRVALECAVNIERMAKR